MDCSRPVDHRPVCWRMCSRSLQYRGGEGSFRWDHDVIMASVMRGDRRDELFDRLGHACESHTSDIQLMDEKVKPRRAGIGECPPPPKFSVGLRAPPMRRYKKVKPSEAPDAIARQH